MIDKKRVLFVCTGNSCRSQMAEGILNFLGGDWYHAYSAGSNPTGYVHPLAIETLREMNIDISTNKSKSVSEFLNQSWDIVITVCDNAKESCPIFPGKQQRMHWNLEDPAQFQGTEEQKRAFFQKIALEIEARVRQLLSPPDDGTMRKEPLQIGTKAPIE
ncbi:MAG: arsenate reductase ArsC [Bacteroidota bacterium]|nr:arsenate reductase ArsC [Bacteroidota bacterium]MDP4229473.1 arsenate reductase ArsC [Bacteroidota bacterium]MDP4236661.1 arsenate reductase ArsC [Bacteroidota bacterium]